MGRTLARNVVESHLDAENSRLYSSALRWIERPVIPEVVLHGAEWLRIAAREAKETIAESDEDELNPHWLQLDREIIALYDRLR